MNYIFRLLLFAVFILSAILDSFGKGKDDFPEVYSQRYEDLQRTAFTRYGYKHNGHYLTEPIFEQAFPFSPNGLALVKKDGYYGYIKPDGEYFMPTGLKNARPFNQFGLAIIRHTNSKWSVINGEKYIIVKEIFDKIEDYQSNGLAIVKYGKKYGLVDTLGNVVLPVIYDKVENFDNSGYAYIKDGNNFGIVDKRGRAVIAPEHADKKHAMSALNDIKSKMAKPDLTLADLAKINNVSTEGNITESIKSEGEQNLLAEKARKEEEQKLLAEKARKEEERRKKEAQKKLSDTYTLKNYIAANLGSWNDYLSTQNLNLPSDEEVRAFIEEAVSKWQIKGEFEPTVKWKERVNETTRTAKINAMADSIFTANSKAIESIQDSYKKQYETLVNRYCDNIARQFEAQNLEIKPYDADNETFLISSETFGDFLLPVPLEEAPGFKQEWSKWKSSAIATFVPNGEDVTLKSVKIGKYSYDSEKSATYTQVDVEYNFRPVDVSALNTRFDSGVDLALSGPAEPSVSQGNRIQKENVRIVAGTAADIDINIPKGNSVNSNTFALVIANSEYSHASKVAHAENDGRVMTQYLTKTLGIPENNVLTFINATYGQMASAISMLQDIGDAYQGSDFNLIFYYVGHGLPDDEGKKSYILPVDIDPRMVSICMPLEKLYADLGNMGAKNVTVMVDACFSGSNHGDGMLVPQSMGVALKSKKASPQGNMIVFSAADGNETAFPYEEKEHGLFTYWILKKLQETSGNVTLGELSDFVIDKVKKTSVTVNHKPQTPSIAISPKLTEKWRTMPFGK